MSSDYDYYMWEQEARDQFGKEHDQLQKQQQQKQQTINYTTTQHKKSNGISAPIERYGVEEEMYRRGYGGRRRRTSRRLKKKRTNTRKKRRGRSYKK